MKVSGDFGCQEDFEPLDFREWDFDMTVSSSGTSPIGK